MSMNHCFIVFSIVFGFGQAVGRNPFSFPDDSHIYACSGIGFLNDRPVCAMIVVDGRAYTVRLHENVAGHEVVALAHDSLVLLDSSGMRHHIFVHKKRPFNLCKLKG